MRISIRHKLFLALLTASTCVAAAIFWFMQWSFDRGLLRYVNAQETEQKNIVAERLVRHFAEAGDWSRLTSDRELWREIHSNTREGPQPDRKRPQRLDGPGDRPTPPDQNQPRRERAVGELSGFGQRLVLLDSSQRKIIGGPPVDNREVELTPLNYGGRTVGYLGLIPASEITESAELTFIKTQRESFALVAIAIIFLSLIIAYPLTSHLVKPIKRLAEGTRKLISGKLDATIEVTSHDELGQLSADFNTLAMTLRKNEAARKQWVADISHELRTPLSVLRGEVEALQDGVRKPTPEALETLHGEILRLGRLVNDLYELSMSDIGALDYRKVETDPIGVLEDSLELFEQKLAVARISLETTLPTGKPLIMLADPDRLGQLFANLLVNTVRYTDAPGKLSVSAEDEGESLTIEFADSPPGVPDGMLDRLFDRLFRVEPSRNRANGGTGLGMAICKNIVEAHGGTIAAMPSPLGGLSVRISLPLGESVKG